MSVKRSFHNPDFLLNLLNYKLNRKAHKLSLAIISNTYLPATQYIVTSQAFPLYKKRERKVWFFFF